MKEVKGGPYPGAEHFLPETARPSLRRLAEAARGCRGCDLYERATQTVFGTGAARPKVVLVGEQPGDQEDLAGAPFVGPAGRLLDRALAEAGLERKSCYVTNAVKHFRWEPRGKRRLHAKPSVGQIRACQPWLRAELAATRPPVIVCLGATAAQSMLGREFRLTRQRGELLADTGWAPRVMATVHPSAILRAPSDEERHAAFAAFVSDLRNVARYLAQIKS